MLSPSQVDHLQDEFDKYIAMVVVGSLIFIVGSTMGIFASQDLLYGTNFMLRLSGAEQAVGLLLIVVGWVKAHGMHKQLNQPATSQASSRTSAAGAGH